MAIDLDTLEQRVIGVLIEKELTTPEQYPLTINALVAGCNQKSNRDPKMTVEDYDVEGALRALMDRGWVVRREPHTGRTMRYAHEARTQLGVQTPDLALLCELLCRGPQAPGALRTRCARMHEFASMDAVEDRLAELSLRPVPYVVELERMPRERQARWQHMLGKAETSLETAPALEPIPYAPPVPPSTPVPPPPPAPTPSPTPAAVAVPEPERNPESERLAGELEDRIERLEERIGELTDRLDRLEGR